MKKVLLWIIIFTLISCKGNSQKLQDKSNLDVIDYHISNGVKFELEDIKEKEWNNFIMIKEKSEKLIRKYSTKKVDVFESKNLDFVLEKWRENKSSDKESKKKIMTLLGVAFGQDLINSFNCEWKIYYDKQGSDFTIIHKVYVMNLFPFSTLYKAIEENKKGTLSELKRTFGEKIKEAENGGDNTKWK